MPGGFGRGPAWWHRRFKGSGYRITLGREAIVKVLTEARRHLSAEDIYMKVHSVYPSIGLTSVYRTLEILAAVGLIRKFDFGDGRARYELMEGPGRNKHHYHLICIRCRRVIDYADSVGNEEGLLKKMEEKLSKKYDFDINDYVVQFYGICSECRKK